jgi:hypothetical protein
MQLNSLLTLAALTCLFLALDPPFSQARAQAGESQAGEIQAGETQAAAKTEKSAKKEAQTLRLRGRIQTGWELDADNNTGNVSDSFFIRRARVDARWMPLDWVKLVLELEFADKIGARDVYGEFQLHEAVALQVGRFKKPFSRLRMMSPWDLLIPDRGLLDRAVIDDTKYGGFGARDYGLMVSGELEAPQDFPQISSDPLKLSWWLGGFNNLPNETNYHRDAVVRTQLRLFKGLVLAIDGSLKLYEEASSTKTAALLGADLKWEWDPFRLQLEGAWGDNVNQGGKLWGSHATASWTFALNEEINLIPALMVEVFDPNMSQADDLDLRVAAALNLDLRENIRLILSLDKTWQDLTASQSALPDPLKLTLQTNLRF